MNEQLKANWEIIPLKYGEAENNKKMVKHFSPWLPKNYMHCIGLPKYQQVFEDKIGFFPNVNILDMLFCCGGKEVNQQLKTQ